MSSLPGIRRAGSIVGLTACLVLWSLPHAASLAVEPELPPSLWTRTAGEDWPCFLGPQRNGKSAETGLVVPGDKQGPKLLWQLDVGEGYGICTVSRGRVYHFDRVDDTARLRCLHAETGKPLWQFTYPTDYIDHYGYDGGPRCSPLVDGPRVYLFGAEGMLHCLSADGGGVLWKVNTIEKFGVVQNFFGVGSNPVIDGDLLIAMVGGSPAEDRGTQASRLDKVRPDGSAVVAFDKRTGAVRYQAGDDLASYASLQLATIGGRKWCFAFARNGLLGLEPASGKVDFQLPWRAKLLESVNASVPVVQDDQVLISETYGPGAALLKVRPGAADVVWSDEERGRDKALQTHWNTPILHQGYVYGCSGRHANNAELRCVRWSDGKLQWTRPGLSRTSLTYLDGHFVCQAEYGQLFLFKANPQAFEPVLVIPPAVDADGRPLLRDPCWAAPVISHGLLYVRGKGKLLCYDLLPPRQP